MSNRKKIYIICGVLVLFIVTVLITLQIGSKTKAFDGNENNNEYGNIFRDTFITTDLSGELLINRTNKEYKAMGEDGTWTVLVYMCASDLQEFAAQDIEAMINASNSNYGNNKVNILIQTGGGTKDPSMTSGVDTTKLQRHKVDNGKLTLLIEEDGQNMASPNTLVDFLQWGIENYPAEHMGVLLWNHGGGSEFGLMQDTLNNRETMSLCQLEYAFAKVSKNMTDKFEFVGFDTCLSGSLEYANILAPYAEYMYASPIEVLAITGVLEPNVMVNYLYDNPDCTGKDLCKALMEDAHNAGKLKKSVQYVSFYDLSVVDDVCIEFNKVAKSLFETLYNNFDNDNISKELRKIQLDTKYLHSKYTCDLGSLLKNIDESQIINCDTNGIRDALDKFIIDSQIASKYKKNGGLGINLYYPKKVMSIEELNLYRNNSVSPYWLKYLELMNVRRKSDNLDLYIENNWENSELYFEKDFDFINYENVGIYSNPIVSKASYEKLIKNPKYAQNGFVDNWYKVLSQATTTTDKLLVALYEKINNVNFSFKKSGKNIKVEGFLEKEVIGSVYDVYSSIYTKIDDKLVCLGENANVKINKKTGKISSTFTGDWFVLADGQLLTTYILSKEKNEIIYGCPVDINDSECTIRIQETDKDGEKEYTILGIWDGTENSLRGAVGGIVLEEGMEITPIYDIYDEKTDTYETEYGEPYTLESSLDILFSKLSKGNYYYTVTFEDYNTVKTYSSMEKFRITDNGIEMK